MPPYLIDEYLTVVQAKRCAVTEAPEHYLISKLIDPMTPWNFINLAYVFSTHMYWPCISFQFQFNSSIGVRINLIVLVRGHNWGSITSNGQ